MPSTLSTFELIYCETPPNDESQTEITFFPSLILCINSTLDTSNYTREQEKRKKRRESKRQFIMLKKTFSFHSTTPRVSLRLATLRFCIIQIRFCKISPFGFAVREALTMSMIHVSAPFQSPASKASTARKSRQSLLLHVANCFSLISVCAKSQLCLSAPG